MMATHITCHSNDCLPNQFPPPRPTQRDYGNVMLSDYEKGRVIYRYQSTPSIETEVEGGTSFPNDDIEPLPSYRRKTPTAESQTTAGGLMDPALCVTPEKSIPTQRRGQKGTSYSEAPSCLKTSAPLKNSRVRFDQQITVQHLSPEPLDDSDIVITERNGGVEENEFTFDDQEEFSDESSGSDSVLSETSPRTYTFGSIGADTDRITNIITQTDELNLSADLNTNIETVETQGKNEKIVSPVLRKIARPKTRKPKYKPDISEIDVIEVKPQKMASLKTSLMNSDPPEHVLARPEFSSTLFISKEAKELAKQQIDLPAAVSEALKTEKGKARIQEKASVHLNHEGPQFPGLVSTDVTEDDLLQAVERKIDAKVKPTHTSKEPRPEDLLSRPPDIMDFFTPDLQQERPCFSLSHIPAPTDTLSQADPFSAFSVYQKVRAWDDW